MTATLAAGAAPLLRQLAAIRQGRDIPATTLARAIGCSATSLLRWETGQRSPDLEHTLRWANALGLTLHTAPAPRRP